MVTNNFNTYLELNDIGEAIVCCDSILAVYVDVEHTDLRIKFNFSSGFTRYKYENIDKVMHDLERLKAVIKHNSHKFVDRYNHVYIDGEYNKEADDANNY